MEFLTDALTRLSGYFYFILIGAIEVIVAIVLIGILLARKKKEKKQTAASGAVGGSRDPEFDRQAVCDRSRRQQDVLEASLQMCYKLIRRYRFA